MAIRSLTITDVDATPIRTRVKKSAEKIPAKKTAILKKQTATKSALPTNAEIMASIKATKSASIPDKKTKAKTAIEQVGSAETTPVTIMTIPVPNKVLAKKTSTAKKATKKAATKKTTKKITTTAKTAHDHADHTYERYPAIVPRSAELQAIKRHPLGHLLLEKKLREVGFRGGISSDKKFLDKYSTDESIFHIRPQVILQPKNRADIEVAAKLIAIETKRFTSLSLTPRAAGTGLSGGSLTDSIVIDVCPHMHKIGEVKEYKGFVTITCEPGAMWRDVEKKLKRHHAYIPSYTSSKDICTIGGSVANNAAGPDSLRYGHCADWVEAMDVVLADGNTYTIKALNLKEYKALTKEKHLYAKIAREIFALVEKNEKVLLDSKPKTKKNSAGYALWNVFSDGVAEFKKGKGVFDLTRLISGSQGTIGIITHLTMRAIPIQENTSILSIPIFDLQEAAKVIVAALKYNPINIEIFDALTFDLALKNPDFFKSRISGIDYYKVLLSMYTTYHIRFARKIPEFTIIVTIDEDTTRQTPASEIARNISTEKTRARVVKNSSEKEMFMQIRRASFTLSKFLDPNKRPAAFLEDMTVPPENLSRFFTEIKRLFKEFNVQSAVHGHGGNGHFHFYPLLDFTNKLTPLLVERMAERFYSTAIKYKGNICGEHNDGIIRTPHLNKMFSKKVLDLFKTAEHIFDPDDIFNPGKKVNPRFDIKGSIRHTN